jgi:hypothetical protein
MPAVPRSSLFSSLDPDRPTVANTSRIYGAVYQACLLYFWQSAGDFSCFNRIGLPKIRHIGSLHISILVYNGLLYGANFDGGKCHDS